ncbi:MAG: AAA family ATPase [Actinomycetota bacterium]
MRPIRMEVKGFTAFRDAQTLEFDGLDLFAISGPTGSGKSSILDAITYALFGYVERVGKQVGQLISQGQPAMSVLLEFAVNDDRYQVTRRTPASGATKILLARWNGDEWQQVGEGADRVLGANAIIRDTLGLDYDAFTRTVLLPQGKFAQFLSGDAKERRDILTELLGLELFERLARSAGDLKRAADAEVNAKETVLAREYAGVTPEAVEAAVRLVERFAERDAILANAEEAVRELAQRGADAERSVEELRSVASEAERAASTAATVAASLEEVEDAIGDADAVAKTAAKDLAAKEKDAAKARSALARAEKESGTAAELGRMRARAESVDAARAELDEAEADVKAAERERPLARKALDAAEQVLAVATADAEAAILAVSGAREDLHAAQHADMAATLRSGVHAGDECPVCGREIERLPRGRRAPTLEKANAAIAKAEAVAAKADDAIDRAKAARDDARRNAEAADRAVGEEQKRRTKLAAALAAITKELSAALGPKAASDPVAAVDARLRKLDDLESACDVADDAVAEAKESAVAADRERDAIAARVKELRARAEGLNAAGIAERARTAGGADLAVEEPPSVGGGSDVAGVRRNAQAAAEHLSALSERLHELAERRAKQSSALLTEMHAATQDLVEPGDTPQRHVSGVAAARARSAKELAGAEHRAGDLERKLEHVGTLTEEIAEQRSRLIRFDALAKELRADRVISFLQAEALQLLAAAGSQRLATLSSDRYRLAFEGDEFFVVDTWNGEERRSVRTLSGGETFLASLALALALSEQVRSLSVSEKARIDSLFLDEGFGTLDPESLEVVVDAIEQLGGDGRMVGVITHVQELAIRLPARIEVEKSPRGSRLTVVAAE